MIIIFYCAVKLLLFHFSEQRNHACKQLIIMEYKKNDFLEYTRV